MEIYIYIYTHKKKVLDQPYLGYVRIHVLHLWGEQNLARLFLLKHLQINWVVRPHGRVVDILYLYRDVGRVVKVFVWAACGFFFANPQRFFILYAHLQGN